MSLRRASRTVRLEAHRYVEDGHGMRHASRQHTLAARYLDLFGTAIDAALAPPRCPRILVLDCKPLNLRAYGAERLRPDLEPPTSAAARSWSPSAATTPAGR